MCCAVFVELQTSLLILFITVLIKSQVFFFNFLDLCFDISWFLKYAGN